MATTLIAVIFALLLGHAVPELARLRSFAWLHRYLVWLNDWLRQWSGWNSTAGLLIMLIPPLLLIGVVANLLSEPLHGLAGFAFSILVVAWCWGPRDLDFDVDAVLNASDAEQRDAAEMRLRREGYLPGDGVSLVDGTFVGAMRRWFGVLLWFLLLGPLGALLFRIVQVLCSNSQMTARLPESQRQAALRLRALLEWPLVHLISASLALVSDFDRARRAWKRYYADSTRSVWSLDTGVLRPVGRASVDADEADGDGFDPEEVAPGVDEDLRHALHLCWRVLFFWLTLLALLIIAGYVS